MRWSLPWAGGHPRRAVLLSGDEAALQHAEQCERCADLLLAADEDDAPTLRDLLATALAPTAGFAERTGARTRERIEAQDVWDLVGDTLGGIADAVRVLADPGAAPPVAPPGVPRDLPPDTPLDRPPGADPAPGDPTRTED